MISVVRSLSIHRLEYVVFAVELMSHNEVLTAYVINVMWPSSPVVLELMRYHILLVVICRWYWRINSGQLLPRAFIRPQGLHHQRGHVLSVDYACMCWIVRKWERTYLVQGCGLTSLKVDRREGKGSCDREDNDKTHWMSHDNVYLLEENCFLQDSRVSVIWFTYLRP